MAARAERHGHRGVTLGGQTFGAETTHRPLAGAAADPITASCSGAYSIELPAASAVLLTR